MHMASSPSVTNRRMTAKNRHFHDWRIHNWRIHTVQLRSGNVRLNLGYEVTPQERVSEKIAMLLCAIRANHVTDVELALVAALEKALYNETDKQYTADFLKDALNGTLTMGATK